MQSFEIAVIRARVSAFHRIFGCLVVCVAVLSAPLRAEDAKLGVTVEHTGSDSVGQRLAAAVREAVLSSSGYKLVAKTEAALSISLITLDPDEHSSRPKGKWTVSSIVFTMTNLGPYQKNNPQSWYPLYLTSVVVTVGAGRTAEYGKSILADLDSAYEVYKKAARN